ncbi:Golgi-associated plant pathogenesis-related protein 1 [Stylophora pistillata]|uniref:Golgi-associated plant pathogenesis-related protein 1 n=1 Tax=Stylophora pistillata TaxID=50429 RepID=A0A2B4RHQ0_STYPI|nr:Golgi-associated plant pathogenesis-related protein 1 [Stylophora pistillata]
MHCDDIVTEISRVIVHSSASPKLVLSTASPTPTTGASTGSSTTTSPDAGEGPYCGQGLTCGPYCQLLCLNMHNYYRDLHGSPPLECDQELATSAQEWTDQQAAKGYMHHSEWTDKFTESISWKGWGWEGMDKMEGAIAGAVRGWYSEIKNGYNYQTGRGTGVIGHFQAVVWAGETRLGCGLNIKPNDGTYVTAHYAPPSHTSMEKEKIAPDNVKPRRSPEPGCNIPSSGRELCRPDLTAPFVNPGNCPLECCYDDMFMAGDLIVFHRGLYKHYAVNVGNGYIVHVTSSDFNELTSADAKSDEAWKFERSSVCSTFDKAVIRKEKYKDYAKPGNQVYVETHAEKAFPSEVIVERANSKQPERGESENCISVEDRIIFESSRIFCSVAKIFKDLPRSLTNFQRTCEGNSTILPKICEDF